MRAVNQARRQRVAGGLLFLFHPYLFIFFALSYVEEHLVLYYKTYSPAIVSSSRVAGIEWWAEEPGRCEPLPQSSGTTCPPASPRSSTPPSLLGWMYLGVTVWPLVGHILTSRLPVSPYPMLITCNFITFLPPTLLARWLTKSKQTVSNWCNVNQYVLSSA